MQATYTIEGVTICRNCLRHVSRKRSEIVRNLPGKDCECCKAMRREKKESMKA